MLLVFPSFWMAGLSPRIRGNRAGSARFRPRSGSIPAHTGKPATPRGTVSTSGVYPRAYGETAAKCMASLRVLGLSPRIRGNPRRGPPRRTDPGSIPAHTGKPRRGCARGRIAGVYPRAYGETIRLRGPMPSRLGLSPRIRGNLRRRHGAALLSGSIPAHTGKPGSRSNRSGRRRVYPRAYGETPRGPEAAATPSGLSPRIRGNRARPAPDAVGGGSIPAHTGKPSSRWRSRWASRVYPRAYGETLACSLVSGTRSGLSPRIRGNLSGP